MSPSLPDEGRAVLRLVGRDPGACLERARALLGRAEEAGDRAAGLLASRAAGLAAKELGRLDESVAHLHQALKQADGYDAALVRMNLVGPLAAGGDIPGALDAAARADGVLDGDDATRLAANLAGALARAGHLPEADAVASRALPRLRGGRDAEALAGLLTNLGLARALRGDLDTADLALTEAVDACEGAGLRGHQIAMARANLAFVASRRGDVPRALRLFAAAEPGLAGERLAQCRFDVGETLIQAGLPGEARPLLAATLATVAENGYRCDAADGLLLLAHAELADGDPERAASTAERARAAFAAQDRAGWTLPAEHLLLRARWSAGDRSPVLLHSAAATADRLQTGGWAEASAEARIIAARVALELGRPAAHLLEPVTGMRRRGPAALRAASWHAEALERWTRHDRRGALTAIWAGLRVVEEHTEVLGALDLRARAAGLGAELAELGLRAARSARELLTTEERRRGLARPAALRPPRDPARAAALAELRALSAVSGDAAPPGLHARQAALEAVVRGRTRLRTGGTVPAPAPAGSGALASALEERALIEYLRIGGDLHAVTVAGGRFHRHHLASYDDVRRAARTRDTAGLNNLLIQPLQPTIGIRELVIAPTGVLHQLPWSALPSLAGRPHTVVPSAAAWQRARSRPCSGGHTVLAAGPGLTHARSEIDALTNLYPDAHLPADAEQVRDALDGADLVHIAAHGEFRPGNALFSRLRLDGGALLVCDLEELRTPPRTVVLSACDVGRADQGDAVIGMVGVLLALGTATIIASTTPVGDEAAPAFMLAFHTALKSGHSPAQALAMSPRPPTLTGLTCFGAG